MKKIRRMLKNNIFTAEVCFSISVVTQTCGGDFEEYTGRLLVSQDDLIDRIMPHLERVLFKKPGDGFACIKNIINCDYELVHIDEDISISQEEAPDAVNPKAWVSVRFEHIEFDERKFGPLTVSHRVIENVPDMTECGNFFRDSDKHDDGENIGWHFASKDGGQGPFWCAKTKDFIS